MRKKRKMIVQNIPNKEKRDILRFIKKKINESF